MQTDSTLPPVAPKTNDPAAHFILVQLKVPSIPGFTPDGARMATVLMRRVLELQLQLGRVQIGLFGCSGSFNGSVYVLKVDQLVPALEALKAAFASVAMLGWAEIGFYDFRENMLRLVHPVQDAKPYPFDMLDTQFKESEQFAKDLARLIESLRNQSE